MVSASCYHLYSLSFPVCKVLHMFYALLSVCPSLFVVLHFCYLVFSDFVPNLTLYSMKKSSSVFICLCFDPSQGHFWISHNNHVDFHNLQAVSLSNTCILSIHSWYQISIWLNFLGSCRTPSGIHLLLLLLFWVFQESFLFCTCYCSTLYLSCMSVFYKMFVWVYFLGGLFLCIYLYDTYLYLVTEISGLKVYGEHTKCDVMLSTAYGQLKLLMIRGQKITVEHNSF